MQQRPGHAEGVTLMDDMILRQTEVAATATATATATDKVRRVQELRRSNAARPHRNKARYTRKRKHPRQEQQ